MHTLSAIVGVFGASVWDISQNHGAMCRVAYSLVLTGLRTFGIHI